MKKLLNKTLYLISCIAAVALLILILYYFGTDYDAKFKATAIHTHVSSIEKEWGTPDYKYIDSKEAVYKYEADILGWSQYVFVFENSLLKVKMIDD